MQKNLYLNQKFTKFINNENFEFDRSKILKILNSDLLEDAYKTISKWQKYQKYNVLLNKCFYFLNDHGDKIHPDHQESGDIFAWPSYLIHGVDKVQEPNLNRLIVAGNVALETYSNP